MNRSRVTRILVAVGIAALMLFVCAASPSRVAAHVEAYTESAQHEPGAPLLLRGLHLRP